MSEEIKKVPVDIADEDLDKVAGGGAGAGVGGVGVGVRKKPGGQLESTNVVQGNVVRATHGETRAETLATKAGSLG